MQPALSSSVPRAIGLHGEVLGVASRNSIVCSLHVQPAYDRIPPALERTFLNKCDRILTPRLNVRVHGVKCDILFPSELIITIIGLIKSHATGLSHAARGQSDYIFGVAPRKYDRMQAAYRHKMRSYAVWILPIVCHQHNA